MRFTARLWWSFWDWNVTRDTGGTGEVMTENALFFIKFE